MRDTYTNSIINDNDGNFKAQNVTHAGKYAPKKTIKHQNEQNSSLNY